MDSAELCPHCGPIRSALTCAQPEELRWEIDTALSVIGKCGVVTSTYTKRHERAVFGNGALAERLHCHRLPVKYHSFSPLAPSVHTAQSAVRTLTTDVLYPVSCSISPGVLVDLHGRLVWPRSGQEPEQAEGPESTIIAGCACKQRVGGVPGTSVSAGQGIAAAARRAKKCVTLTLARPQGRHCTPRNRAIRGLI